MHRLYAIVGSLALALMAYGNVQGWSLFQNDAQAQGPGSSGSSGRLYHK